MPPGRHKHETVMSLRLTKEDENRVRRPDTTPHMGSDRSPDLSLKGFSGEGSPCN